MKAKADLRDGVQGDFDAPEDVKVEHGGVGTVGFAPKADEALAAIEAGCPFRGDFLWYVAQEGAVGIVADADGVGVMRVVGFAHEGDPRGLGERFDNGFGLWDGEGAGAANGADEGVYLGVEVPAETGFATLGEVRAPSCQHTLCEGLGLFHCRLMGERSVGAEAAQDREGGGAGGHRGGKNLGPGRFEETVQREEDGPRVTNPIKGRGASVARAQLA